MVVRGLLGTTKKCQGIGKDGGPRAQRTPMGNPYIIPMGLKPTDPNLLLTSWYIQVVVKGFIGTTKKMSGHWLPELSHLSDDEIHTPWVTGTFDSPSYPGPCVDPERFAGKKGTIQKKAHERWKGGKVWWKC